MWVRRSCIGQGDIMQGHIVGRSLFGIVFEGGYGGFHHGILF